VTNNTCNDGHNLERQTLWCIRAPPPTTNVWNTDTNINPSLTPTLLALTIILLG